MSTVRKAVPLDKDPKNYLGFEFEHLFRDGENDAKAFQAALKKRSLAAKVEHHFECLSTYPRVMGWEATFLVDQEEYKRPLLELLSLLKVHGAYATEHCGLHIHVDLRHRGGISRDLLTPSWEPRPIEKAIYSGQRELFKYCAPHRPLSPQGANNLYVGRMGYDTIEVRCMEMNWDIPRICRYVDHLLTIVNPFLQTAKVEEVAAA